MDDIFRMTPDENARRFYFAPERVRARVAALTHADPLIAARNRATVVRLGYPRFLNPALANWLHRVDVPTLLIWGENDGLVPPIFGEAYRKSIPSSRLVVMPARGSRTLRRTAGGIPEGFHRHAAQSRGLSRGDPAASRPRHSRKKEKG